MINRPFIDNLINFIPLFIAVFLFSGVHAQVTDQVVLSVGDVTFSRYELEKNLNLFKTDFTRKNNVDPTSADIKKWTQSFIDRSYFLADAYQKGFDTLKEVNAKVISMEHLVLSQPGGLLDEKMAKDELTPGEVENALQIASKEIIVACLDFENKEQVVQLIGEPGTKNQSEFNQAVVKNYKTPIAEFKTDTLKWPFTLFGDQVEMVAGLKANDIIFLPSADAHYYLIHIKEIQTRPESSANSIKNQVVHSLMRKKQVNARAQYQREIEQKAQIIINDDAFSQFIQYMQNHWGLHEFDKKVFSTYLQLNLIYYNFDNKRQTISLDQLIDYYNHLPIKRGIEREADIFYYLQSMVYDKYACQKAKELGLTREIKFLLDKENYKKNMIYSVYEKQLKEGIHISEEEIKEKYESGKAGFTEATEADVLVYAFSDLNKAVSAIINLKKNGQVTDSLPGLEKADHKHIDSQNAFFSDSLKMSVFSLKVGEVSRPVLSDGKYILIVKESESGKRIKSLSEMKDSLIKEIKNEKLRNKAAMNLEKFKSLYPLKNEINYQEY